MKYLETISVPIDEPVDFPGNARVHDDDWLDRTTRPGQHRSIFTRRLADGTLQILAGHGTREAFRRKGNVTVRVEVVECTDEEALQVNLSDNPPPGIGGFDDRALIALLEQAQDYDILDVSGWDEERMEKILSLLDLDRADGENDPYKEFSNAGIEDFENENMTAVFAVKVSFLTTEHYETFRRLLGLVGVRRNRIWFPEQPDIEEFKVEQVAEGAA